MARTNEWTETLVDWVDGRLRQNRFSNLWLGGGAGAHGGSSYRPIDGQLTQRHVCYDTSEATSPCSPSGFSSLVDNLRRIRYWQEPATWFGVTTSGAPPSGSCLNVYIKPGLWYPSTTEYCAFAGGNSPTFTLPGVLDRIDTIYVDPSGVLHIQRGTPAVSPTITLPPIASGIPLWAVHLTPTASGITFIECSGYYNGMGYIERDLRPFLNLGGGGAVASGVLPASNRGAILRGGVADWETYNVGAANEVLTNDGTDVIWSTGAINLTAGKTLVVSVNLTLAGVDGKSLTIEENSILNQDLTTDASVTFADVFVPDGGTFGISGNELLTVNAAGNFTFSGVTSIVVPDGTWVGADANCAWLFNSTSGYVTAQDDVGVGTTAPEGKLDVAYSGGVGKMTLLLGADIGYTTRSDNTNKMAIVGAYHYTNAEEPLAVLYAFSSNIVSTVKIGGGNVYCNAATEVAIYTALNRTTLTGTKRFSVANTGAITVTGPSFTVPDGWWLGIGAAVERIIFDSAGAIAVMGANLGVGILDPGNAHIFVYDATVDTVATYYGGHFYHIKTAGVTDENDNMMGLEAYMKINQAAGIVGTTVGMQATASIAAGEIGQGGAVKHLEGLVAIASQTGGTVWGDVMGMYPIIDVNAGTIGRDIMGMNLVIDVEAAVTSIGQNVYGLRVWMDVDQDPVGTVYGIHITEGSNQDYGIYQNGSANNYFGGDVGIGVSPNYRLAVEDDVAGGFVANFFNDGNNVNRYGIRVQAGADNGAAVGSTFYFYATDGDGTSTGNLLTVDGVFQLQDVSDRNRKTKIKNTKTIGLDIINGLQVRDYNWKANPNGPVMTSFVAQEAQKVFPAMITKAPDGTLMTARAMLIPVLTKAIQELDARLTRLETK